MDWDCQYTITNGNPFLLPFTFTSPLLAIAIDGSSNQSRLFKASLIPSIAISTEVFKGKPLFTGYGKHLLEIPYLNYQLTFIAELFHQPINLKIKQIPNNEINNYTIMNVSGFQPIVEQVGNDTPTTVTASVTSVTLVAANTARREGFIENKSNRPLWVNFGTTAATGASPSILVPALTGNVGIPENYTGAIQGIWVGAAPTLNAIVHEFNAI
jgi:hypothetical protein